jgi:hypothetical protein
MEDKEMFSYWVTQPELLVKSDIEKLERLTEKYPYFQLAHMLLAKAVSTGQPESLSRYLPKAALYSLNRKALHLLVENEMEWSVELLDRLTRTQSSAVPDSPEVKKVVAEDIVPTRSISQNDIRVPFDPTALTEFALTQQLNQGYEKPKEGTAPRTPIQELIDKFIKAEPAIGTLPPGAGFSEDNVDLSQRNQAALEDFATESFAEILIKQGKIERAIGIYEKLILKIPEKKGYFAQKIERLK